MGVSATFRVFLNRNSDKRNRFFFLWFLLWFLLLCLLCVLLSLPPSQQPPISFGIALVLSAHFLFAFADFAVKFVSVVCRAELYIVVQVDEDGAIRKDGLLVWVVELCHVRVRQCLVVTRQARRM